MYIKRITLKEFSLIQHNFGGIMCKAGLVCITNNKLLGCRHGGRIKCSPSCMHYNAQLIPNFPSSRALIQPLEDVEQRGGERRVITDLNLL